MRPRPAVNVIALSALSVLNGLNYCIQYFHAEFAHASKTLEDFDSDS